MRYQLYQMAFLVYHKFSQMFTHPRTIRMIILLFRWKALIQHVLVCLYKIHDTLHFYEIHSPCKIYIQKFMMFFTVANAMQNNVTWKIAHVKSIRFNPSIICRRIQYFIFFLYFQKVYYYNYINHDYNFQMV